MGNPKLSHVPFRQSKLTHVLKDSLGGGCKTTMVANIWGDTAHVDETAATLRFATRIGKIANEAQANISQGRGEGGVSNARMEAAMRRKDREISELRAELAMYDMASHRAPEHHARQLTPQACTELRDEVLALLEGERDAISLPTLGHAHAALLEARRLWQGRGGLAAAVRANPEAKNKVVATEPSPAKPARGRQAHHMAANGHPKADVVPASRGQQKASRPPSAASARSGTTYQSVASSGSQRQTEGKAPSLGLGDGDPGFTAYRSGPGKRLVSAYMELKSSCDECKRNHREAAHRVNRAKGAIDELKTMQGDLSDPSHTEESQGLDEIMTQLKTEKRQYREAHTEMRALKTEIEYLTQKAEAAKTNMLSADEAWISANPDPASWGPKSSGGGKKVVKTPRRMPSASYPMPEDDGLPLMEEAEEAPVTSEAALYAAMMAEAKEKAMATGGGKPRRGVKVAGTFDAQGKKGMRGADDYGMQNSMQAQLAGWGQKA